MGCFQSKKESSDLHPNVFRVVNIDENRADLCSGQLEITESDIILYREGRDSTVWPLHSLRRYGFEEEIFSFESGRRCETGEGIYAFKCRRASLLFQKLQQQIQLRNVHDSVPYPVSRLTPPPQGRQTLQASVVHRSSIDNGQPDNLGQIQFNNNLANDVAQSGLPPAITQSPRSPSSADILEVMPLYPRPQANSNHVTNVYQVRDFKREHNNNQADVAADNKHVYTNDFNRDLAMLRNTLRQEMVLNTIRDIEDETRFLENRYLSENIQSEPTNCPISPTMSNSSDHYTQLSIEQQAMGHMTQEHNEPSRLYVNLAPNENSIFDSNKNDTVPTTPLTPKQVEYCNLIVGARTELNIYANLMLGDGDGCQNTKPFFNNSEQNHKFSESDMYTPISPVEDINYAVLDIDSSKDSNKTIRDVRASPESQSYNSTKNENTGPHSAQPRGRLISQNSIDRLAAANTCNPVPSANIGYTTIDFDKTVALTSVAAGAEVNNMEGSRKHRQNSCSLLSGSPSTGEKSRGNN